MKRYVISPVIGTGTEIDSFRASVSDVVGSGSAFIIPTNNIGQPLYAFAMGLAATTNMNSVAAVSNAFIFPDYPLDGLMSGMDPDARTAMNQSVGAYVFKASPLKKLDTTFYGDSDSYRDVLNGLLHQIDINANVKYLDAAE